MAREQAKAPSVVHKHSGKWWYLDFDGNRAGPFKGRDEARSALLTYGLNLVEQLNAYLRVGGIMDDVERMTAEDSTPIQQDLADLLPDNER